MYTFINFLNDLASKANLLKQYLSVVVVRLKVYIYLSIYIYIYIYIYQSLNQLGIQYLSIYLSQSDNIYQLIKFSVNKFLSFKISPFLSINLSIYLSQSVGYQYLFIHLFIYLFIYLSQTVWSIDQILSQSVCIYR